MPETPPTPSSYLLGTRTPLAIAHRGGSLEAPENTMRAFSNAVSLGYAYLETDVRMTKDGVLVIFHDKEVDRLTEGKGKLSSLSWDEVSRLRVSGEPIPRVEEVLKTWPHIYWNLDPKISACVKPLTKIIKELKMTGRVCVGSFLGSRQRLAKKLLGSELVTSAGPLQVMRIKVASRFLSRSSSRSSSRFSGKPTLKKFQNRHQCLQVPLHYKKIKILDKKFLNYAHKLGLQVHIWTIDNPKTIEELIDLGVDGIMTDAPSVLKKVFFHKGIWNSVENPVGKKII